MREGFVSAIIVNYNGKAELLSSVESVLRAGGDGVEVVVVDNASRHRKGLQLVREAGDGRVRFVSLEENAGFAGGVNAGLAEARGEFVLLLNCGATVEEDYLESARRAMAEDRSLGMVTGKIYRCRGEKVLDSTGFVMGWFSRRSRDRGDGETDRGQYDRRAYAFGGCAAALFLRRRMLEDVKVDGEYMDEDFFMYLEDLDLAWRAQLRGWRCLYLPAAVAYHAKSGAGQSLHLERHALKNLYLMRLKNEARGPFLAFSPLILALDLLRLARVLTIRPRLLSSYLELKRCLPAAWRKRKVIQAGRRADGWEMERWFKETVPPVGRTARSGAGVRRT